MRSILSAKRLKVRQNVSQRARTEDIKARVMD